MWWLFALLSAVFAALTSILAKVGIESVDSNLATAIRTMVVVGMSWLMVFVKGKQQNYITDEHIDKIVNAYTERKDIEKYCHIASLEEIAGTIL